MRIAYRFTRGSGLYSQFQTMILPDDKSACRTDKKNSALIKFLECDEKKER